MTGTRYAQARVGLVFCYAAFLRMRIMMMGFIGALVFACSEAPPLPPVAVELSVEILAPEAVAPSATVFLSVYHAWTGEGDLRHPLGIIESFETKLGTSTFRFNYPVEGGDGVADLVDDVSLESVRMHDEVPWTIAGGDGCRAVILQLAAIQVEIVNDDLVEAEVSAESEAVGRIDVDGMCVGFLLAFRVDAGTLMLSKI